MRSVHGAVYVADGGSTIRSYEPPVSPAHGMPAKPAFGNLPGSPAILTTGFTNPSMRLAVFRVMMVATALTSNSAISPHRVLHDQWLAICWTAWVPGSALLVMGYKRS